MRGKLLWKKEMVAETNIIFNVIVSETANDEITYKIYSAQFLSDVTLRRLIKFTEFLLSLDVVKDNLYVHIKNGMPIFLIKSTMVKKKHDAGVSSMYLEYIKFYMKEKLDDLNGILECINKEYDAYKSKV
jgi:hypothetical protein